MKKRFVALMMATMMAMCLLPGVAIAAREQKIKVTVHVRIWTGKSSVTGNFDYNIPPKSWNPVQSLTTKSEYNGNNKVTDFKWTYEGKTTATFKATATSSASSSIKWGINLPSPEQLYSNIGEYKDYKWAKSIGTTYNGSSAIGNPYWPTDAPTGCTISLIIWKEPAPTPTPTLKPTATPTPSESPNPTPTPSADPMPTPNIPWVPGHDHNHNNNGVPTIVYIPHKTGDMPFWYSIAQFLGLVK